LSFSDSILILSVHKASWQLKKFIVAPSEALEEIMASSNSSGGLYPSAVRNLEIIDSTKIVDTTHWGKVCFYQVT
jgi:hypothetical protein